MKRFSLRWRSVSRRRSNNMCSVMSAESTSTARPAARAKRNRGSETVLKFKTNTLHRQRRGVVVYDERGVLRAGKAGGVFARGVTDAISACIIASGFLQPRRPAPLYGPARSPVRVRLELDRSVAGAGRRPRLLAIPCRKLPPRRTKLMRRRRVSHQHFRCSEYRLHQRIVSSGEGTVAWGLQLVWAARFGRVPVRG